MTPLEQAKHWWAGLLAFNALAWGSVLALTDWTWAGGLASFSALVAASCAVSAISQWRYDEDVRRWLEAEAEPGNTV